MHYFLQMAVVDSIKQLSDNVGCHILRENFLLLQEVEEGSTLHVLGQHVYEMLILVDLVKLNDIRMVKFPK